MNKGIVIRYLMKVSGYSRQQVIPLIRQYRKTACVKHHHINRRSFQVVYFKEDIRLLSRVKQLHHPCGQALKKLCERASNVFDEVQFKRLTIISVSHLYNLRKTKTYCNPHNLVVFLSRDFYDSNQRKLL